MLRYLHRQFWW